VRDVICNEAVPFRPYCAAGVATRTRNVSEYMLVLALCLVCILRAACQDLLAQRPARYGFVRRKTAFQDVGEKIESRLKVVGRSLSNKMPCTLLSDALKSHV